MFFNNEQNLNNNINEIQTEIQNNQNNNFNNNNNSNNNILNNSMNYHNTSYNKYNNKMLNNNKNHNYYYMLNRSVDYDNEKNKIFDSNLPNTNTEIIIKNLVEQIFNNKGVITYEKEKERIAKYIIEKYNIKKINIFEENIMEKVKEEIRKKMREKIKESKIEKIKEILNGRFLNEYGNLENRTTSLNKSIYDFRKNLKKLAAEYKYIYNDIYTIVIQEEDSLYTLKFKNEELINFIQSIEYEEDVFKSGVLYSNYTDFQEKIYNILELKNSILKIKNKALKTISKYSKQNNKIIKEKLKKDIKEVIEFCDNIILYFEEKINKFYPLEEEYIFELVEQNNKMIELEEKILECIKSNILNLENNLKNNSSFYYCYDNSKSMTSDEENENDMQDLLDKKIEEKLDENKTTIEEPYEYEDEELTKKEEQEIIDHLMGINKYSEYVFNIWKEDKKIQKRVDKDKNKLEKLEGCAYPSTYERDDYFGLFSPEKSTGVRGAKEEFKINIKHLMDIYIDEPNEVEKMFEIAKKSHLKLKDKNKEYVRFAKKVKYKEKTLNIYNMMEHIDKVICSTIKLKKQIDELKNKILEKIKTFTNKEETKKFEKMLKNLTTRLITNLDETAFNLSLTIKKHNNAKDKNKYLDELLDTEYNTTIDLGRKIINYLELLFNDYKNLK